jgi:hypothetical protein
MNRFIFIQMVISTIGKFIKSKVSPIIDKIKGIKGLIPTLQEKYQQKQSFGHLMTRHDRTVNQAGQTVSRAGNVMGLGGTTAGRKILDTTYYNPLKMSFARPFNPHRESTRSTGITNYNALNGSGGAGYNPLVNYNW